MKLLNILFFILIILIALFYLNKINIYPVPDSDETQILSFFHRLITYGENRSPVTYQKGFHSEQNKIQPFVFFGVFRNLFLHLTGFSSENIRIISAFMILTVVVIVGLVSLGIFRSSFLSLLPIIIVGLHPNVFMAARSLRHEQEIAFLGMIGMFAVPFLNRLMPWHSGRLFLMCLSGILVGWVATLHPWGIAFMAAMFFTFIFYSSVWQKEDGINLLVRVLTWGGGVALPGLLVLAIVILNWHGYVEFFSIMSKHYDISQRIAQFSAESAWLKPYLPDWLIAHISLLGPYTFHYHAIPSYQKFYVIIFGLEAVFVISFAMYSLITKKIFYNIFVIAASWLALIFLGLFFLYPPSVNYLLYPALTLSLGFSYVALTLWENRKTAGSKISKFVAYSGLISMFAVAAVNVSYALAQSSWIWRQAQKNNLVSLDTKFQAIERMGKLIGLDKLDRPVFSDFMTWIAAGKNQEGLFENNILMLSPVPKDIGGVTFELPDWQAFLDSAKNFATGQEKLYRLGQLIKPLELAGVVFDKQPGKSYYFYVTRDKAPASVIFGVIAGEKNILWETCDRDGGITGRQIAGEDGIWWQNLPEGFYVLSVSNGNLNDSMVRVNHSNCQEPVYEIKLEPLPVYSVVQRQVLLEVKKRGGNIQLKAGEGVADAVLHKLNPWIQIVSKLLINTSCHENW